MEFKKNMDFFEPEGHGIPMHLVKQLFDSVKYGTSISVGLKILHNTGCRLSELDNMNPKNIEGNFIYWNCGKNQRTWRKEFLPDCLLEEIKTYRDKNSVPGHRILTCNGDTFSRYFVNFRKKLSLEWSLKTKSLRNNTISEHEYKYQLKGFRKNFATLLFVYFWKKYDDAEVSLLKTCKRLKHSSSHMTAYHYVETAEQIDAERFVHMLPFEIYENMNQKTLLDYAVDDQYLLKKYLYECNVRSAIA